MKKQMLVKFDLVKYNNVWLKQKNKQYETKFYSLNMASQYF